MKKQQIKQTTSNDNAMEIEPKKFNRKVLWSSSIVGLLLFLLLIGYFLLREGGRAAKSVLYHHQIVHIDQLQTDAQAVDDRISNVETFFTIIKINKNKIILEDKRAMLEELRTLAALNTALEKDIVAYRIERSLRWHIFRQDEIDQIVEQTALTTVAVDQFIRNAEYMMYSGSKKDDLLVLIDEQINRIHTSIKALRAVSY